MSGACRGLPDRHASLATADTSRLPWLRWSNEMAISPFGCLEEEEDERCAFQSRMMCAANGVMDSCVWRRGCRSQRQAIEGAFVGRSARPWRVGGMTAMW